MTAPLIAASTAIGVILAVICNPFPIYAVVIALALVAYPIISYGIKKRPLYLAEWLDLYTVWSVTFFIGIGAMAGMTRLPTPLEISPETTCSITARIENRVSTTKGERYLAEINYLAPNKSDNISTTSAQTEEIRVRNTKAYIYTDPLTILSPGDIINLNARLRAIPDSTFGHEFSRAQYTIYCRRFGKNPPITISVTDHQEDIFTIATSIRENGKILIEKSSLNNESRGLVKALLLAEKGEITGEESDMFRDAGISHILAVSGMHVGIIASILLLLSAPMALLGIRNARYILVIIAIWVFAFLTGLSYSTMRASLMLTLAAIAWILERQRDGFSAVCAAAYLILVISPAALFDVGFQLSFTCVAALCLFVEKFNPFDHRSHPIFYKISSAILTTLVATGATWLISGYYFGSVPIHFLSSNLIVLPFLPIYMVVAIVHVLLLIIGLEWSWLSTTLDFATEQLYTLISHFNGTSVELSVTLPALFLWMAGLGALAFAINLRRDTSLPTGSLSKSSILLNRSWLIVALLLFATSILLLILANRPAM